LLLKTEHNIHWFWLVVAGVLLVAYGVLLGTDKPLRVDSLLVSAPFQLLALLLCIVGVVVSGDKPEQLGLSIKHWRVDILRGLGCTIPLVAGALVYKILWSRTTGAPVLNQASHLIGHSYWIVAAYAFLVPAQNFICRCCLQAHLMAKANTRGQWHLAVIVSSLIYSASHLHLSWQLACLTLVPGLLWGYLFAFTGSVLAPVVSHFSTGLIVFYFIGLHHLV
jgi:membrane protease YdiL (CAAX protease family)